MLIFDRYHHSQAAETPGISDTKLWSLNYINTLIYSFTLQFSDLEGIVEGQNIIYQVHIQMLFLNFRFLKTISKTDYIL